MAKKCPLTRIHHHTICLPDKWLRISSLEPYVLYWKLWLVHKYMLYWKLWLVLTCWDVFSPSYKDSQPLSSFDIYLLRLTFLIWLLMFACVGSESMDPLYNICSNFFYVTTHMPQCTVETNSFSISTSTMVTRWWCRF